MGGIRPSHIFLQEDKLEELPKMAEGRKDAPLCKKCGERHFHMRPCEYWQTKNKEERKNIVEKEKMKKKVRTVWPAPPEGFREVKDRMKTLVRVGENTLLRRKNARIT